MGSKRLSYSCCINTGIRSNQYEIRQATENDAEDLLQLDIEHDLYYTGSAMFMPKKKVSTMNDVKNGFTSKTRYTRWVALDNGQKIMGMNV